MTDLLKRDDWEDITISALDGGLSIDKRADLLQDSQSPNIENVWFDQSYVQVDRGYAALYDTVRGSPRKTYQFKQQDGTSYHVLITDDTFYVEIGDTWHYVSDGADTTLSANEALGQTALSVVSEAGFSASDFIGITLNDGSQHQTTVASTAAGVITVDDALPSAADSGKAVVKAVDLTSSLDDQIDLVPMPAVDWLIFTNNADNVKRYDGSTVEDLANLPSAGDTQCKALLIFNNHLLLLNTTEGGTAYPQRVRNSDTGDPTNWTTGNAGYEDLYDRADALTAGGLLGPYAVVYRESAIVRGTWVGSADKLIDFRTVVTKGGCLGPEAFADTGDTHLVMWRAGIYEYKGGFDIDKTVDVPIHDKIFGSGGELTPAFSGRSLSAYVENVQETWFFYPRLSSEKINTIARFKHEGRQWAYRKLQHDISGIGTFISDSSLTWQEAPGIWLDYTYAWRSIQTLVNSPSILLGGATTLQVYEYDYVNVDDAGLGINFLYETKDFVQAGFYVRIDWVEFYIAGGETSVDYSVDSGQSWITYGTLPASATIRPARLYGEDGQVTDEKIRWRVSGTGEGFKLGWFKMRLRLESQW